MTKDTFKSIAKGTAPTLKITKKVDKTTVKVKVATPEDVEKEICSMECKIDTAIAKLRVQGESHISINALKGMILGIIK